jgi:hypothetical protein
VREFRLLTRSTKAKQRFNRRSQDLNLNGVVRAAQKNEKKKKRQRKQNMVYCPSPSEGAGRRTDGRRFKFLSNENVRLVKPAPRQLFRRSWLAG